MLHRERHPLRGNIKHAQHDWLGAIVLAMVDGAHHFDKGLALAHHLDIAVPVNDGEFALLHIAEVYHVVMMPAQFRAGRELISD